MKKLLTLGLTLLALTVNAAETKPATKPITAKQTVLFFMNPNGAPCIMQDKIIKESGTAISNKATVTYVKTTEFQTARPLFEKYGIRGLPTLIILDSKGAIKHRFTPGIQTKEAITAKL